VTRGALVVVVLGAGVARADDTANARALFEQGVQLYKAQKYDEAAATLAHSYELERKPDVLFALAQAERMSGRCPDAVAHYKALLAETNDLATAKAVQNNLGLCEAQRSPELGTPPEPPSKPETAAAPHGVSRLPALLVATGGLALGIGGGLLVSARGNRDAAGRAFTLEDNARLNDRADTQQTIGVVAAGAGVALAAVGAILWVRGKRATVAISHSSSATVMAFASRW
jgi:hypothetical protein